MTADRIALPYDLVAVYLTDAQIGERPPPQVESKGAPSDGRARAAERSRKRFQSDQSERSTR